MKFKNITYQVELIFIPTSDKFLGKYIGWYKNGFIREHTTCTMCEAYLDHGKRKTWDINGYLIIFAQYEHGYLKEYLEDEI